MKTFSENYSVAIPKRITRAIINHVVTLAVAISLPMAVTAADTGKSFETPEDAVSALADAVSAKDAKALRDIFGPVAAEIMNPDRVQATNEFSEFTRALTQAKRIVRESNSKCVLEVGENSWPFPIPLAKREGRWFFDTEAGKDELFNRRIGKNELTTLQVVRAYVEAQREYATKDRDRDQVLEFAQKFRSTSGTKDGLYWPADLDCEISPLGPLAGWAQVQGYGRKFEDEEAKAEPFHGYFFKVLTGQAKSAPGGKYDYIINQNMIGGFALVAWPAEYGESGIMTFIVNQQGQVYQKDLGPKSAKIAAAMKEYSPDRTWTISRE